MKHKKFLLMSQLVFLSALFWCVKKSVYLYKLAVERTDKKCYENLFDLSYEESLLEKLDVVQNDIWIEDTNHKEIFISSFDNLNLYGLVIEQSKYSDDWVIIVHGYNGFGIQMADSAKKFYEAGFNVILPDCRGHGKSQGNYIGMGWHDRLDILQWIKFIIRNNPYAKIILYGLSMGAATVLMTSGENLPPNIKCIIEDCAYTSVIDEFSYHYDKIFRLPHFPMFNITDFICQKKAGYKLSEASAVNQLKKCKTPVLFIHGEKDNFVPTYMVYKLYESAKCPKDILIVPKAGHGISSKVDEKRYWRKVFDFTEKYF
jgi:Hydrolases of the alpha/beta superfamily